MPDGSPTASPRGGDVIYRHRRSTRAWHWVNALTVFVMLMSRLMIFNAHPRLYWGKYGANHETPWLEIGSSEGRGYIRLGALQLPAADVLGISGGEERASKRVPRNGRDETSDDTIF